jgi:predicted ATP-dependent endonuclease of OLD family
VYSLERSAEQYFNNKIAQLIVPINHKNILFIDLNNWGKTLPHIEVIGR